jgi:hypothetical protein
MTQATEFWLSHGRRTESRQPLARILLRRQSSCHHPSIRHRERCRWLRPPARSEKGRNGSPQPRTVQLKAWV